MNIAGKYKPLRSRLNTVTNKIKQENTLFKKGLLDDKTIEECLDKLKEKQDEPVDQLKGEYKQCYETISTALSIVESSGDFYDVLAKKIENKFKTVENPKPNTVAGRLAGCLLDQSKVKVPVTCTPSCINSIKLSSDEMKTKGLKPCDYTVILGSLLSEGYIFTAINNVRSSNALLYINSNSFNGFTNEDLAKFKEEFPFVSNITVVSALDHEYKILLEPVEVDKIPIIKENTLKPANKINNVLIVIIVLIIVLILLYFISKQ